jgi:hypothetical protein
LYVTLGLLDCTGRCDEGNSAQETRAAAANKVTAHTFALRKQRRIISI